MAVTADAAYRPPPRARTPSMWKALTPANFPELVLLAAGTFMRIDVYVPARMAVGEILIVVLGLAYGFLTRQKLAKVPDGKFLLFLGLWVAAVVASDLVNQTAQALFQRGLARPILIGLLYLGVRRLVGAETSRMRFLFIGLMIAGILNLFYRTDFRAAQLEEGFEGNAYYAFIVTPALVSGVSVVAWLVSRWSAWLAAAVLVVAAAAFSTYLSRTTSNAFIVCAALGLWGSHGLMLIGAGRGAKLNPWKWVAMASIAVALIYGGLRGYIAVAAEGHLGLRLQEKVITQTNTNIADPVASMLLAGRHYSIADLMMVRDHPVFGTGSWPVEGPYVLDALDYLGYSISARDFENIIERRGIGHSIILGGWANYGPAAVPFWLLSFVLCVKLMIELVRRRSGWFWLVGVYLLVFIFSIWFNNLNSINRLLTVIFPVLLWGLERPQPPRRPLPQPPLRQPMGASR